MHGLHMQDIIIFYLFSLVIGLNRVNSFSRGCVIKSASSAVNSCTRDVNYNTCFTACSTDLCNIGDGSYVQYPDVITTTTTTTTSPGGGNGNQGVQDGSMGQRLKSGYVVIYLVAMVLFLYRTSLQANIYSICFDYSPFTYANFSPRCSCDLCAHP